MAPLNSRQAAAYLGISLKTLYKWKQQACTNQGYLILCNAAVRFRFRQTGAMGQGRILFERCWLDELKAAMEASVERDKKKVKRRLSHITANLGIPTESWNSQ